MNSHQHVRQRRTATPHSGLDSAFTSLQIHTYHSRLKLRLWPLRVATAWAELRLRLAREEDRWRRSDLEAPPQLRTCPFFLFFPVSLDTNGEVYLFALSQHEQRRSARLRALERVPWPPLPPEPESTCYLPRRAPINGFRDRGERRLCLTAQ